MDWKSIVSSVAPVIGGAVGGPFGAMAAKAGLSALGISPESGNEEAQLQSAIENASPQDLLMLKQANQQFKKDMKSLDVDVLKIDAGDRKNARGMPGAKNAQIALSIAYTVAYAVVVYNFMMGNVHVQENQQVLFGSLIGILTAAQVQILNFWFGSSSGSKDKTAALSKRTQ